MFHLKESAINLAENRTFRSFVILYVIMSIVIVSLMSSIYYIYRKELMLSTHHLSMQLQSESYMPRLKSWMQAGSNIETFPKDIAYSTGLFDENKKVISSNLEKIPHKLKNLMNLDSRYIYLNIPLSSYELGNKYLIFEVKDDELWIKETFRDILIYGSVLLIALAVLGYYLSRLILSPMKESIKLLDSFIKDTTHELNTPLSAILSNIEMIDSEKIGLKEANKLRRIEIAAKTISMMYDDLTYLILNHKLAFKNESLNLAEILNERLECFKYATEQKKIIVNLNIDEDVIFNADRANMIRIFNNLLSNAVKYNNFNGKIEIILKKNFFLIKNSGKGIEADKIKHIFERYQRADESVGGFGIGLHVVAMITKEYDIKIDVTSNKDEGTSILLSWK